MAEKAERPAPAREFRFFWKTSIFSPSTNPLVWPCTGQWRELWRHRAAAASPSPGQATGTGAPAGPGDLGNPAGGQERSALTHLQDQFRERETGKTYLALVTGQWAPSNKVIDLPLHKYLQADGERCVRVTTADDPTACAPLLW